MGSGIRRHHVAREGFKYGDLKMVDIVQIVLFILAGTFLYGLVGFLFRDQITHRRG
jgi:hypothetical protein